VTEYFYFVASLPSLALGSVPPIPYGQFAEDFPRFLTPGDSRILAAAALEYPTPAPDPAARDSDALSAWYGWDRALRNELARLRAQELGRDAEPWIQEGFPYPDAVAAAKTAFAAPSPMEGELALGRARWDAMDRLRGTHYFDREALVVYSLQLQLLERLAAFDAAAGSGEYRRTYDAVMAAGSAKRTGEAS
jgi:hypothetical protein